MTRRFLVWMLLIALPLQSFAAAAMLHCAPPHHAPVAHAEQEGSRHHGAAPDHAHHADATVHHDDSGGHAKADKCSACDSCCAASVSLVSFRRDALPPEGMQVLVPHPVKPFLSITLDSPQRPPRPSFA